MPITGGNGKGGTGGKISGDIGGGRNMSCGKCGKLGGDILENSNYTPVVKATWFAKQGKRGDPKQNQL